MPAVQSPFSPQPPERNPLRLIENEKNDVLSNIEDLKQNLHTLECRLKSVQRRLNSLSDCQLVVDVNPYSKKGIFNAQPSSSDQQKTGAQPITDPRLSQDFIIDESSPPSTESSEANTSQLHSNSTFKSFASVTVKVTVYVPASVYVYVCGPVPLVSSTPSPSKSQLQLLIAPSPGVDPSVKVNSK